MNSRSAARERTGADWVFVLFGLGSGVGIALFALPGLVLSTLFEAVLCVSAVWWGFDLSNVLASFLGLAIPSVALALTALSSAAITLDSLLLRWAHPRVPRTVSVATMVVCTPVASLPTLTWILLLLVGWSLRDVPIFGTH